MSTDRLTALATLARIEADAAPEGGIKKALMSAAGAIAAAVRMLEDVAAGACPGCGAPAGQTTAGCENLAGCGRRALAPEFKELLARPPVKVETPALVSVPTTAGQKAAATRAARKVVA